MNRSTILNCLILFCLTACAVEPEPPRFRDDSLRGVANAAGVEIGVAIDGWQFDDTKWQTIVAREFNLGTIQWGMYWPQIEPRQGEFEFSRVDMQLQFATQKNLTPRGHALIFPESFPDWLSEGKFTDQELLDVLTNHVRTIVGRYKGVVKQWVVVNETYLHPYRQKDIFYERFGYDYIVHAFRAAREADSAAVLLYGDTGNHRPGSPTTELSKMIVDLLKEDNLIDGIGMHMHLDGHEPPDSDAVISAMRSYGVNIYITEFDVDMREVNGSQFERYVIQAEIYRNMLDASLASGVCRSMTFWQIGDGYSWLEFPSDSGFTSPLADPTMFDDTLTPKPAYNAIHDGLRDFLKRSK